MSGLNLHSYVRGAISAVHPDEYLLIVRSIGQTTDDEGNAMPLYFSTSVYGQLQSENDSALFNANLAGQNEITRRIYLYAGTSALTQTRGIFRPLSRNGDMIQRADGTWWLVTCVVDDYSSVGWMSVRATMQVEAPQGWIDPRTPSEGECDD